MVSMLTPIHHWRHQQCKHHNWTIEQHGRRWSGLINRILFYITWSGVYASLTWWTPGTRMHYRKKATPGRQCDALGNVMLCGCYFDTHYLHNHCHRPIYPFMETVNTDASFNNNNNVPCHKAKMVQGAQQRDWDVNLSLVSPELNPIEHVWDVLDKQPRFMEAPPRNLNDLKVDIMLCLIGVCISICLLGKNNSPSQMSEHPWQPLTSKIYYVLEAGEIERCHNVMSIQNPWRVHQTHEFQHVLFWSVRYSLGSYTES